MSSSTAPPQSACHGTLGRRQKVVANCVEISKYPEGEVYQYDVVVTPERGDFKKLPPPTYMRLVFDAAMREHRQTKLQGIPMVYDSRKIAYAPKRLCGPKEVLELDLDYNDEGHMEKYKIRLREAAVVQFSVLTEYLRGRGNVDVGDIQAALNALDLAIGSVLHLEMVGFNRSFFTREQSMATQGGLELWSGFSFSVRPGIDRLYLNVNTAVTAMYSSGSLLDALMGILGVRDDPNQLRGRLTQNNVRDMNMVVSYLRGLHVYCSHRGLKGKRKFSVRGATTRALDQETFEWEDPDRPGHAETITVAQYFERRYNLRLKYPFLPGITDRRKSVFPLEFCDIVENQRYRGNLNDKQTADMVKFACQKPNKNMERILDILQKRNLGRSPIVQSFGLALPNKLAEVESRVLPAPTIKYGSFSFAPQGGAWNMQNKRVSLAGAPLSYWAVLVLASQSHVPKPAVESFVRVLVSECEKTGYPVNEKRPPIVYGNLNSDIAREMEHACKSIRLPPDTAPQLLLVVLPSTDVHVYQTVKNCAYTTLGIHTQCMQSKHIQRPNMQYCANLCLKINAKLGGVNQDLKMDDFREMLRNKITLFMGCDVTHPAPGEREKPSIASVVGSTTLEGTRYAATLIQLPSRAELVDKLRDAMIHHLRLFHKTTRQKPQRIVFYRDGVSESQFSQVRDRELIEIQRACSSLEEGYRPEITFLAVLKRHNTRFFPMGRDGDRTGNCVPGTVVDRSVTMPGMIDFYLFAHAAIQGTSRPTHYYVLHDDAKFTADAIQQLTYNLCYTYAICTRSVSLVPPVYYAHRVADRARCHLVDMGRGFEEASTETAGYYGGAGSTTLGTAPGDPRMATKIISISTRLSNSMYFM
ncbi:hypothetical protein GGF42_001987 [Coemansia sp. RSA 2424]|nr:hypothetical protein GGF42_001987 [Coemansia sp. RSA 2424]